MAVSLKTLNIFHLQLKRCFNCCHSYLLISRTCSYMLTLITNGLALTWRAPSFPLKYLHRPEMFFQSLPAIQSQHVHLHACLASCFRQKRKQVKLLAKQRHMHMITDIISRDTCLCHLQVICKVVFSKHLAKTKQSPRFLCPPFPWSLVRIAQCLFLSC